MAQLRSHVRFLLYKAREFSMASEPHNNKTEKKKQIRAQQHHKFWIIWCEDALMYNCRPGSQSTPLPDRASLIFS